jgi:hypothetical protein
MANDTPKRRGRPRKDPNDTTTAPYVKHRYDTEGKRGRPKKNPYEGSGWGGKREGAGLKPYLEESERKNASINFRVRAVTKRRYELLRDTGMDVVDAISGYIDRMAATRLGANNIPDNWTPPKKK